jgi:competence protein ComEC
MSSVPLGIFTRRPALPAVLLLALGILLHEALPFRPQRLLIAIALVALAAIAAVGHRLLCPFCLVVLIFLLGVGLARREHFAFSDNDIIWFATDEPQLTELEIRLDDDPQVMTGPASQRLLPPKQVATGEVLRIKTWTGWITATGRLPIQNDQVQPAIRAGQTVRLLGMLQRPRAAANPGEFDWAAYYRRERIGAQFTVTRAGNIHILADPGPSLLASVRAKARHLLAAGFTNARATDQAVLNAMLLGDRDPPLRDIEPEFQRTGIAYQLSVSGLHIALFAWLVFWLCRVCLLGPRWTLAITTAFVLLYASVALPSHSGVRAAILSIITAAAVLSGRPTDRTQLVALAALAMLLWHPMDLYTAGFHLSFAVVIAFLFLLPAMQSWLASLKNPDDIARPKPPGQSTARQLLQTTLGWIARSAELGLIGWLATLPLVVYHFGQASSWSVLGSLLLLPLVLLSLLGGALKILLTLLWPIAARWWAVATDWPVHALLWGVHQLARVPGSAVALPEPPIVLIVVYYLLLFAPLLPYRWGLTGRRRWILRLAPLLGVAAIFFTHVHPITGTVGELRVTLLSLGAGQCAVVEPPGAYPVLIDAGSMTVTDVARKLVEPFLHAEGQPQVNEIFLSHGDFDHISAAGEITEDLSVRQVFTSYHFRRNAVGNIPDQLLLEELGKLGRSPREIAIGDHFDIGGGAEVSVLWPPKFGDLNSNNAGLVLRLAYAGRSILFPADIQDPAFTGVLRNPAALKSDVLVAPHHGSSEELTPAFLAAVKPQVILSSNFWRLTSKQKRFETMIGRTPLYRTPECGAITVTIRKDGTIAVTTFVAGAKPK